MQFGLTDMQMQWLLANVVKPLNNLGAEVYCFGSRARGDNQPFSDLDLMVVSACDLARPLSHIDELASESNFPFIIDLVEEQKFASTYVESYLADRILVA